MYTIQEAKDELKAGMKGYLRKDGTGAYCCKETARMPFYLEGKPGIGKSEIVRQVAEELEIGFVSFSITHHTRSTLLGLPVIVEQDGYKYTEYTMSEIIAKVKLAEAEGYREGILLLDEFNCASETIFPMMLALLQTRNIGYYRLPEGWNLVLLGNPRAYNKSARELDAALLDRVRKLEIDVTAKDFLTYAKERDFHPLVQSYLASNSVNLYYVGDSGAQRELVTCRGWENLSHTLYAYEELGQSISKNLITQFIKSEEIAGSFASYYEMNRKGSFQRITEAVFDKTKWTELSAQLEQETVEMLWRMVEQLVRHVEQCAVKEKNSAISVRISQVLQFLSLLTDGEDMREHFFRCVNGSKVLRDTMFKVKNEEYLSMCRSSALINLDL